MTRTFWSIPGFGVFVYSFVILVQNGFNDYFSIPRNFIESSLVANITFLKMILESLFKNIILEHWFWSLIVAGVIYLLLRYLKKFTLTVLMILGVLLISKSYSMGNFMASQNQYFYTLDKNCAVNPTTSTTTYVAPIIYEDKLVLIPIDTHNKILNGFRVIETTNLNCSVELINVGQIKH